MASKGNRPCPVCGATMHTDRKETIEIEVCPEHGIWLDKGEMEEIAKAVKRRTRFTGEALQRGASRKAKTEGKVLGSVFGFWSLLFD